MAKLTPTTRRAEPASDFGLPAQRKYPMPDASHAANAKARVTQQVAKGNATPAQKTQVDAKANGILGNKVQREPAGGKHAPVHHTTRRGFKD